MTGAAPPSDGPGHDADHGDSDATDRSRTGHPPAEGHEWTCPVCGESRFNRSGGEAGEENAVTALRAHVLSTDGADHGPKGEFPAGGAPTLSDHVTPVEDRR